MILTSHQPNYLPWLGFFSKIKHADCFVISDDVSFSHKHMVNRNKIRTKEGWCYLTIPVSRKFDGLKICDVRLPDSTHWQEEHWNSIQAHYRKAKYFDQYEDFFEQLYQRKFEYLSEVSEEIILFLFKCFDINVKVVRSSEMDLGSDLRPTERIIARLKKLGATTYLSGPSGRNYLDTKRFEEEDIKLDFFEFKHPVYEQRFSGFVSGMAAIDLLFNLGEKAKELVV